MAPKETARCIGGAVIKLATYEERGYTLLNLNGGGGGFDCPAIPLGARKGGVQVATIPAAFNSRGRLWKRGERGDGVW